MKNKELQELLLDIRKQFDVLNKSLETFTEKVTERIEENFDDDSDGSLPKYDPHFGDDRVCQCGHPYYRHFDSYEDMEPVGCKYCQCFLFQ